MRSIKQWLKREAGQSVVLVALSIAMLCGVAALVVDVGMVSVREGQLQNAADAAALAAARDLPSASTAKSTAVKYAGYNGVAATDTVVTTPYNGNPNRVEVVCNKTVQYTFAKIFGAKSIVVSARAVAEKAAGAEAYHKIPRRYLGVPVPLIEDMVRLWRAQATVEERVALADALWHSGIHEAMVAAAKLLTQARLRPDAGAWAAIASWAPEFEGWAVADHACNAGGRRLVADPSRLDAVEGWLQNSNMWTRRAALVITLPYTKSNNPTAEEQAIRTRVLGWCATLAPERDWFIQKAVAWWLRELSKHDAPAVRDWLALHGETLKPFARKEAAKYLR